MNPEFIGFEKDPVDRLPLTSDNAGITLLSDEDAGLALNDLIIFLPSTFRQIEDTGIDLTRESLLTLMGVRRN